jgi:Transposase domain (DUF772)
VIPLVGGGDQRGRRMMGRREDSQVQFLYAFDLDKVVPADHLVRQIDAILDLSWVHRELRPYYSHTGRPSIDPVLMIRMLLVGYVFALRSERRLCSEVQVNLAYRWFCKLSVEDKSPIIRCSAEPGTNASARAMLCGGCLRAWWLCASRLGLWAAKRFRSMRA